MRWPFALDAKVLRCTDNSRSKSNLPQAIDSNAARQGMFTGCQPARETEAGLYICQR